MGSNIHGISCTANNYLKQAWNDIKNEYEKNQTYSMFTEIEGPYDEVMVVIKEATFVLADKGIRTIVSFKADIRPGFENTMTGKIERLNERLGE